VAAGDEQQQLAGGRMSIEPRQQANDEATEYDQPRFPCIRDGKPAFTTMPPWRIEELSHKYAEGPAYYQQSDITEVYE